MIGFLFTVNLIGDNGPVPVRPQSVDIRRVEHSRPICLAHGKGLDCRLCCRNCQNFFEFAHFFLFLALDEPGLVELRFYERYGIFPRGIPRYRDVPFAGINRCDEAPFLVF